MVSKDFGVDNHLIVCIASIALISTSTIFLPSESFGQTPDFTSASVRGFFNENTGKEIQPLPDTFPNISELLDIENSGCPGEIAIYVHGVWADEEEAWEQGERVFLSLQDSGYNIPVIGYSWDSNTPVPDDSDMARQGWGHAKEIANGNGKHLGRVILDYKGICPNDDVRLIAHSLGARVTLAALQFLHSNPEWTNSLTHEIKSVHLVGAAVDNEQISTNAADCSDNIPSLPCSGEAIDAEVGEFFNLYDPEDNLLQFVYDDVEHDNALGWCGEEGGAGTSWWLCFGADDTSEPEKYYEYTVRMELPAYSDSDVDNDCDDTLCLIFVRGDNHFGYLGYRGFTIPIINNGAMDEVAADWREQG
jgi:pimeloyl-ACP methyl ester carboxylesterase